ncbi:hypothetical protein [Burkholderia sp. Ax-1719]|uniref:hypothetical protein n=1 Tax=Burkholderia sp. Ax-1719 TaxID=2608334 RepID=UPI0019648DB3|nr:hypothetical protein [Burkholderia sp. Ax-1719]
MNITNPQLFNNPAHRGMNRWIYTSPKTKKTMGLVGNLRFVVAVLLTGDLDVASFSNEGPTVTYTSSQGKALSTSPDFVVDLVGGGRKYITTLSKRTQAREVSLRIGALSDAAITARATHEVFLGTAVNKTLFDNWALLSARMNCADPEAFDCSFEGDVLRSAVADGRTTELEYLLGYKGVDSARMLSSLGYALMRGAVRTNLETKLLSLDSKITQC